MCMKHATRREPADARLVSHPEAVRLRAENDSLRDGDMTELRTLSLLADNEEGEAASANAPPGVPTLRHLQNRNGRMCNGKDGSRGVR